MWLIGTVLGASGAMPALYVAGSYHLIGPALMKYQEVIASSNNIRADLSVRFQEAPRM